ncbi:uncharacterized protein PFL1_02901 [Pseudozyma flocculosa PF-1]|uniref:non-specific serine/threonine protein kinase n=2 Tax=Pseudozyma flocculosa TaxID=84751 RepID=A0A5C3F1T1_9BASI|nr:uncharacterized protein PFL1_02901 [Pseudozyma flocculosa PF-1]EPQ29681.1 hypothetical protein PFL1_02901 [Pseudozyma flocculosa PF-1]SPO38252.1 related to ARK1 - Actin Regulating Kinase [Pseudozyma flocculosa]
MHHNTSLQQRQRQQQQQQHFMARQPPALGGGGGPTMGFQPPPQAAYKGTLAPGTRVKVGGITVTVKRYLSEGGFAHVYLVTTAQPIPMPSSVTGSVGASASKHAAGTRGETTHVLKRMAVPDKEALADVRREVEVHKLLRNQPNIVHFIEASATALQGGGYEIFILMEFCSGGGIIDLMNARLRDRLREDEVLKIFGDVCAGVAVMHHQDPPLMHRDLKVENILMSPSVGPDAIPGSRSASSNLKATFKLCDFGSAAPVLSRRAPKSMDEVKRVEADLNKHTTLQYRAPEMVDVYQRRVIDEKADIWALGVFLYKLCYYTTPFEENGGGPLAILNVQYRFPPQPAYSQKLKDLIASLLIEQSTQRPSIDQVILDVHKILGTRPPSSAAHYAQLALSGKIVAPLPSVSVSTRSADNRPVSSQSGARPSAEAALISIGPTKQEREEAETRQLAMQTENITPMRRGRPTKQAAPSVTPDAGGSVAARPSSPKKPSSHGDRPAATSYAHKRSSPSDSIPAAPTSNGFDDSFKPGPSPSFALRAGAFAPLSPPSKSTVTPPFSASAVPGSPISLPPRPSENAGSPSPHLLRPINGASPGPNAGSQAPSPFRHSPALPGFSATNSPAPSPVPGPNGADLLRTKPASRLGDDDGAAGRFPSVEEIDARYASPSPVASPPASASSAPPKTASMQIPGLSSRASVGALAGRINRANTVDIAQSGEAAIHPSLGVASGGNVQRRWQPSIADPASRGDLSRAPVANPMPTKPPGYRTSKLSSQPLRRDSASAASEANAAPSSRTGTTSANRSDVTVAAPSTEKGRAQAEDWLTGDGLEDALRSPPLSSRSDEANGIVGALADVKLGQQQSPLRSAPRHELLSDVRPSKMETTVSQGAAHETLSSDDEAEGPEDADPRRPSASTVKSFGRGVRSWTAMRAATETDRGPDEAAAGRLPPGRLKAPSWLVEQQPDQPETASSAIQGLPKLETAGLGSGTEAKPEPSRQSSVASVVSPTRSEIAANQKLDDAARDAQEKLEELLRGPHEGASPPPGPEKLTGDERSEDRMPPPLPSRVPAPAWDDDEDEMRALPLPELRAASASRPVETGNLVDLGSQDEAPRAGVARGMAARQNTTSSTGQSSWLQDLMDDESVAASEVPSAETGPRLHREPPSLPKLQPNAIGEAKQYADAATSPQKAVSSDDAAHSETGDVRSGVEQSFSPMSTRGQEGATRPEEPTKARTDAAAKTKDNSGDVTLAPVSVDRTAPSSHRHGQPKVEPGFVRQRQHSLVGEQRDHEGATSKAERPSVPAADPSKEPTPRAFAGGQPKIIMPKPMALRPSNSSYGRAGGEPARARPMGGLKPWEKEAAAAAEISKSGIVRSSGLRGDHAADPSDHAEDEGGGAPRNDSAERFGGVSSLISKWQQNVESQAPGWGRIGSSSLEDQGHRRSSKLAGHGRGLGPAVADQAAASVQGRRGETGET